MLPVNKVEVPEVRGILEPFFETGTEGVHWALSDPALPGYDGLHILEDGDELRIFSRGYRLLWTGTVCLDRTTGRKPRWPGGKPVQQTVLGMWVHGLQANMDPEIWGKMFTQRCRATLRPVTPRRWDCDPHPFSGSLSDLHSRLVALPQEHAENLFRSSIYPWLIIFTKGDWYSLAQSWGFSLTETLALLGSSSPEMVEAWAKSRTTRVATLLPFSLVLLERLALLFRLNAVLLLEFSGPTSRSGWLKAKNNQLNGCSPETLLFSSNMSDLRHVIHAASARREAVTERYDRRQTVTAAVIKRDH